jgi:hypothetical protein
MQQARDALMASARGPACTEFVASIGAGGDAKQEVWDGRDGMPLGEFLCQIDEHGTINSYAGPGMFSSTSTLKVTPLKSQILTISMHKVEVKQGKSMLVGFEVKDAAQASGQAPGGPPGIFQITPNGPLTVEGWELFIPNVIGMSGLEAPECIKIIEDAAPDKLAPAAKVFWLHCWTFADVRAHVERRLAGQQRG